MIITVTINPAIDKTAGIETIHPRALNRLTREEKDGILGGYAQKLLGFRRSKRPPC